MQRIGGIRRRSRYKFTKVHSERGKVKLRHYFQKLEDGEKVRLSADPAFQKGLYHQRFHGKIGVVSGKSGEHIKVRINDLGKEKTIVIHPVHLRKI